MQVTPMTKQNYESLLSSNLFEQPTQIFADLKKTSALA